MVEHFTLSVLRDIYLLDLTGDQVSVKKVHVGDFIHRFVRYSVDSPHDDCSGNQSSNEALRFRVSFWLKEIVIQR